MPSPSRLLLLLGTPSLRCAAGWRTWDQLPNAPAFHHFVGKFCFDVKRSKSEEAGRFEFLLRGRVRRGPLANPEAESTKGAPCWGPCDPSGNLYLVVFDDEEDHWKQALDHWHTMGCREMLEYASWAQNISEFDDAFNRTVSVHEETRPRFWYFAFAACGVDIVEPVTYELHTENMLQNLQSEFGLDEKGALQLQLAAALLFVGLAFVLRFAVKLPVKGHLHNPSEAVLDRLGGECLHYLARGLSLHHADLAEDLALAGLGRRLRPGLQPAEAGQIEDARLGHLLGRQLGQAVDDAGAHGLLQLARGGQGLGDGALGHGLR